jgi:hypothetical protein
LRCADFGSCGRDAERDADERTPLTYKARVAKDIAPGVWQVVFQHGSAYAVSIVDKTKVNFLVDVTTACRLDKVDRQWSELYWTLRYQDTVTGPLERIDITTSDLRFLMDL